MGHRLKSILILGLWIWIALAATPLFGQKIIKVISGYVLIDRDAGLGQGGDRLTVYRYEDGRLNAVGTVEIVTFQKGKTAAKILSQKRGRTIAVDDYVSRKNLDGVLVTPPPSRSSPPRERAATIQARPVRGGIGLGRFVPGTRLDPFLISSFSISGFVRLGTWSRHTLQAEVACPILKMQAADALLKPSMFLLHLVDRIRIGDCIHWDVGAGVAIAKLDAGIAGQTISESRSDFGLCVGFSADFPQRSGWTLIPFIRVHAFKSELYWSECAVAGFFIAF